MSLHREKHMLTCLYNCLFPRIQFRRKCMSCLVFTHEISNRNIKIYRVTFPQCVWTWNYNKNRNNMYENPLLHARLLLLVFIVKKAKIFWSYARLFWIVAGMRKYRILIGVCKWAFLNCATIFLNWYNKTKLVPASFSCP